MKRFLIIGSPISHSMSPKIHNYWFKENNIDANYEKKEPKKSEIHNIIKKIKNMEIHGINITVPYKQEVIQYLDTQSEIAKKTNSVNTIYNKNGKVHGDNTDVFGFENSIINNRLNLQNKSVQIMGAGGVVPSIILGLRNLQIGKIYVSNRTFENAKKIKDRFNFIEILEWGEVKNCDLFINSTSLGLKNGQDFNFTFDKIKDDSIFIDTIYNPLETKTLKYLKDRNIKVFNGLDMFIYQGQKAFYLWNKVNPEIDQTLIELLLSKLK